MWIKIKDTLINTDVIATVKTIYKGQTVRLYFTHTHYEDFTPEEAQPLIDFLMGEISPIKESRWIPVNERIPESKGYYKVQTMAHFGGGRQQDWDAIGGPSVTHWEE